MIRTRQYLTAEDLLDHFKSILGDIEKFIDATHRSHALGVPVQHNADVIQMLQFLAVRIEEVL